MMDVGDEDKRVWLCKHFVWMSVCALVTKVHIRLISLECRNGVIMATIAASRKGKMVFGPFRLSLCE